jgi:pimeloyl-ACP methyl ester carboxylesterase
MLFLSPFLLILGLMQLAASRLGLCGLSLTGRRRRLGYLVGAVLFVAGVWLLPATPWVFAALLPAGGLALAVLVSLGSLAGRELDPARFLRPGDWPEARCRAVQIPHGENAIPGLLITPWDAGQAAVCLVHGSGDNKTAFKWRLIRALLRRGLAVLTIDLAGHGENQAVQRWPDCTAEIPAALCWLRQALGMRGVGLLGVSMGGALSAHAAAAARPDALAICEAPISFRFTRRMVRREVWRLLCSPILDMLGETTWWQIRRIWDTGRGQREIALAELIERLDVPGQVARLSCPLHLVYGQCDDIAPPEHGLRLREAAAGPVRLTMVPRASHLALTLMPETGDVLADWFAEQLDGSNA